MSAGFTPGPWSLDYHGEITGTRMYFVHRDEATAKALTICADNEADARLIAAAPTMYEAIRRALVLLNGVRHDEPTAEAIATLHDARKAAEGEQ